MKDLDFEEEDLIVCPSCRGAGQWINFRGNRNSCPDCGGTGEQTNNEDEE